MRILMLSDMYPPFVGGIEHHVRNLSIGLVRRGHEVSVATMTHPQADTAPVDEGVVVHRLSGTTQRFGRVTNPTGKPHSPPFPDPGIVRALRSIVRRERPEIVHAHDWIVRSFLPVKPRDVRLIMTLHNYGIVCAKQSYVYAGAPCTGPGFEKCLRCSKATYGTARGLTIAMGNWLMQGAQLSAVDRFIPVSNAVAEGNRLAQHQVPFEVIPNFVPDDVASRRDDDHPTLGLLPKGDFWLYVGALSRHKGVHVLLDAYQGLVGAPPLVLIGPQWHDTPARLPANVLALGSLPHAAVMSAWHRCVLGFVPSVFPDPSPTVAMEAMACGVPLIASRVGGLPDIVVDGETGVLVEHGSPSQLRAAMQRLLDDPRSRAGMGERALQRVPIFMASSVIGRLDATYSKVIGESGGRAQ
jgi:glycosyltransferase involved in cell wall biosynthesis